MLQVEAVSNGSSVLKLVNPKHNISIHLNGESVEVALLKFGYTPKDPTINTDGGPQDPTVTARDFKDKLVTGERWNWCQILGTKKSTQCWTKRPTPRYAALVNEIKEGKFDFANGTVIEIQPGQVTITAKEFLTLPVLASLTGTSSDGHYHTLGAGDAVVVVEEPAAPAVVEAVVYTGDKFEVVDGHYVGDDQFTVPNDFAEFYEWQPHYIRNWVKKRLHKQQPDDDVLDWEQELTQHMMFLPATSKHRLPGANGRPNGCADVVMTFNPYMQYGASERRFRNYINNCLANKFMTLEAKEKKNPITHFGNYSLASQVDTENYDVVDDEYVHSNSEVLSRASSRTQKQHDDKLMCREYLNFVNQHDPDMLKVITAIAECGTLGEAARQLSMTEQEFSRARNRLKQLGVCFQKHVPVPKQRKQYKTRIKIEDEVAVG